MNEKCKNEKLCEKNNEDTCDIKKDIATNEIVEYKDIENVRRYVDKILNLEKDSGVN